jgi:uncharacterized membrane-anchored protein
MKKILFTLFIVTCMIQIAVPVKMIWNKENAIKSGKAYKFRTAPVDPYDPFRGKYITLSFDANECVVRNAETYGRGDFVYVSLGIDSAGFAIPVKVSKEAPSEKVDYVTASVQYVYGDRLRVEYPFNHFYMEESKAKGAEAVYREANRRNSEQTAYALVYIHNGEAALDDVLIDGVSVKELAGEK